MKTSSWPGRRLHGRCCALVLCTGSLLCTERLRAQELTSPRPVPDSRTEASAVAPQTPQDAKIEPGREPDAAFLRRLSSTRDGLVGQHLASARRHSLAGQHLPAVLALASAYAYRPDSSLLFQIARACRKADLDHEGAAAYQQILASSPDSPQRSQIDEELRILAEKIEDMDLSVPQRIHEHLDTAKRAFQSGQYLVAAQEYSLVYALKALPRLLFNIAQSYRRAGLTQEAYQIYTRFLEAEPQTPLRKETNGYLMELRPVAFGKPLHKRAWFWAVVGTSASAIIAAAAGGAVAAQRRDPATDGGTFQISFGLLK